MGFDIETFKRERDAALFSLDKDVLLTYCRKYGVPIPDNELVFWAGIYKCICALPSAPPEKKAFSTEWLLSHGFKAEIF